MDIQMPQLQAIVDDEKKKRKLKDEEIKEKIKNKIKDFKDNIYSILGINQEKKERIKIKIKMAKMI